MLQQRLPPQRWSCGARRVFDLRPTLCLRQVVKTLEKGFGLMATEDINPGALVIEYVGEVITLEDCKKVKSAVTVRTCLWNCTLPRSLECDSTNGY